MMHFLKYLSLFVAVLALTACGGGGGSSSSTPPATGGGGTPPPTATSPSSLTVSASSAVFEGRQYQDVPPPQELSVTASGDDVAQLVAGFAPGVTPPDWLSVDFFGTVDASTLTLGIVTTDRQFGVFSAPLRIVTATATDEVIDTVDINVTYDLERGKLLRLDKTDITVRSTPGSPPITEIVTLSSSGLKSGETISWDRIIGNIVGEDRVALSPGSGTLAPGETQEVELTITPQSSGVSSTSFIPLDFLVEDDARGASMTIRADSINGLFSDPSEANFTFEEDAVDSQTLSVILRTARFGEPTQATWNAEADQDWVSLVMSGASDLEISVDPSSLAVGRHEAVVSVTHDISDQVLEIPVIVIISGPALKVSQMGVALSDLSSLSRQISVTDSDDTPVSWSASSSETWLEVTTSGSAGDPLIITADTAGLAPDSLVLADVIVTNADLQNDVTIQVGLWVGGTLEERVDFDIDPAERGLAREKRNIVADPIRPYVYVKTERPNAVRTTDLSTYNVYTGEQVGETMLVDIDPNGDILVSDDGKYLFIAGDNGTGSDTRDVAKIDLLDMTSRTLGLSDGFHFSDVVFARVKTQAILLSSRGDVMDVETEEIVSELALNNGSASIRVSKNGNVACQAFDNGTGGQFNCVALSGSGIAGESISIMPLTDAPISAGSFRLGAVFEISNEGENLIMRDNPDFGGDLRSVNLADQSDNFNFRLNFDDLAIDSQDNIIVRASVYDENGNLIASDQDARSGDQIVLSGDESRLIQLNNDRLFISPIPQ